MLKYLMLIIILFSLTLLGCSETKSVIVETDEADEAVGFAGVDGVDETEPVSLVPVEIDGGSEDQPYYSEHHIDGWLSDYECVASLDSVNDVLRLGKLIQGYEGEGLILDEEFGQLRFTTVEEVGLSENEKVAKLPNGIYTGVISETNWVGLKAYVESKL